MDHLAHPTTIEPLTAREQEILRLLASNLTARAIANHLHLSPTTVKWYTQQIYGKLGIEREGQKRRHAVARARALGLLEAGKTPGGRPRYSLPAHPSRFIGRDRELDELTALLSEPHVRMITLLGPGGIGKTRLAVEVAWRMVEPDAYSVARAPLPGGAYFVPLQSVDAAEDVFWAIAEAVSFHFQPGKRDARQQLFDFFHEQRLLLVLDNFEQVLGAATLVGELLQAAPGVQALVTSRVMLGLQAETVYPLGGLAYADAVEDFTHLDAVRLFLHRAQQTRADFTLQPQDVPSLLRVCQLVQGMPLALVLAATWVSTLSLPEIADEVACCPEFLAGEMADAPPRHWSIRALFEPTWQRLTEPERAVFIRLAVFPAGGTRQAIQAITGANLPVLQSLVNKAILSRTPGGRYEIHELLRQFAAERLDAAGDTVSTQDAHCAYYAGFLAECETDIKGGARQLAALAEIDEDFENIRLAWDWAIEQQQADMLRRMAWPLGRYLYIRGRDFETLELHKRALSVGGSPLLRAQLLAQIGLFSLPMGRRHEAIELLSESLDIARAGDDPAVLADALRCLANATALATRDTAKAYRFADEALAIYRALDDSWGEALCFMTKGMIARSDYDYAASLAFTEAALEISIRINDRFQAAIACMNSAHDGERLGDLPRALEYARRAFALYREFGESSLIAGAIGNIGNAAMGLGDYEVALAHLDQALVMSREFHRIDWIVGFLLLSGEALSLLGRFDEAADRIAEARQLVSLTDLEEFTAEALVYDAIICYRRGDFLAARRSAEEAFAYAQANNLPMEAAQGALWLALAEIKLGDTDSAREHLRASLPDLYWKWQVMQGVYGMAVLALLKARPEQAAELAALVECHRHTRYDFRQLARALLDDLRGALSPDAYDAAVARGHALDVDAIVAAFVGETGA